MRLDRGNFDLFSDLRNQIEASYWDRAVRLLTSHDHLFLQELMGRAWIKLHGSPVQIPHTEHRQLHMAVYSRLENPFVLGLLEAYWEAYEQAGYNIFADYNYLREVWNYHQSMVDAICTGNFEAGYQALITHKDLLYQRS
jgi:DNA-binding FadR family transcriptional regulator